MSLPPVAPSGAGSRGITSAFLKKAPRCNRVRPQPSPGHQGSLLAKGRNGRKGKGPPRGCAWTSNIQKANRSGPGWAVPSLEPHCLLLPLPKTQPLILPLRRGRAIAGWERGEGKPAPLQQQSQKGSQAMLRAHNLGRAKAAVLAQHWANLG